MKRIVIICVLLFVVIGSAWAKTVRVGIVSDGAESRTYGLNDLYKTEIRNLLEPEHTTIFIETDSLQGDWTKQGIDNALNAAFADPQIDIILALGVISSHEVANRDNLSKPVIAPFIIDPQIQIKKRPLDPNLNMITFPTRIKRDMKLFSSLIGSSSISVMISKPILNAIPELMNLKYWKDNNCCPLKILRVDNDINLAIESLPTSTQGVYLAGLPHLSLNQLKTLTNRLTADGIPTFSMIGKRSVDMGVMASSAGDDVERIARTTALNIQLLVLGSIPEKLTNVSEEKPRLLINRAVAAQVGFVIPYTQLIGASFIDGDMAVQTGGITLVDAVEMAVKYNSDLQSAKFNIEVAKEQIAVSRSIILPNMKSSITGLKIDKDRAKAGMGLQAEETIQGALTLTQILYSEQAFADLNIQKSLLVSKKKEVKITRLDIMEATAIAYLNVLKIQTLMKIQQDNLEKSRKHLEIARIRESVGQAGPAEVYRWMNIIATSKQDVISSINKLEISITELNRLTGLDQNAAVVLEDLEYNAKNVFGLNFEQLKSLFDSPAQFRKLQNFMVKEAIVNSPEMKQLDAIIVAQKRLLLSKKRSYYLPTVALQADVIHRFIRNGEGQELSLPIPVDIDERDNTDWNIGITMSLPLFEGGGRSAKVKQESANLKSLVSRKRATRQRIEQRMRISMLQNYTSYSNIQLSKEAAEAAHKSFSLVEDAYSRGIGSILDLIDAQSAALVSDLLSANAMYSFYMDYIYSKRAMGNLNFRNDIEKINCWWNRMQLYVDTEEYQSNCN